MFDSHPYKCEKCGKKFTSKHGLAIHKGLSWKCDGVKCDLPPKSFVCGTCGKAFDSDRQLNGHMIFHKKHRAGSSSHANLHLDLNQPPNY
ncbi:hypothetical protein DEO72_LG5g2852 [Vigna unguiculata]|uniref:C2H2-type domain-containing protein n=1 Tax=Vigna unguiculata TaxID=3917 RepID=A0A4D6M0Z5_VIGUN|nr:hypothetical protein DEO72_LG5g2852 [Vigna unguiculata]